MITAHRSRVIFDFARPILTRAVRSQTGGLRGSRREARVAAGGFWRFAQKRFDVLVDQAADTKFAHILKETAIGKEVSARTLAKTGLIIGVGIVAGVLGVVVLFKNQIARQTGTMTAGVTTTVLQDEEFLNKMREMVRASLSEPATRAGIREMCLEVLKDPPTQAAVRDICSEVLKDPCTRAGVRELCCEVLSDPRVHDGLGVCIRSGLWHSLWPWAKSSIKCSEMACLLQVPCEN